MRTQRCAGLTPSSPSLAHHCLRLRRTVAKHDGPHRHGGRDVGPRVVCRCRAAQPRLAKAGATSCNKPTFFIKSVTFCASSVEGSTAGACSWSSGEGNSAERHCRLVADDAFGETKLVGTARRINKSLRQCNGLGTQNSPDVGWGLASGSWAVELPWWRVRARPTHTQFSRCLCGPARGQDDLPDNTVPHASSIDRRTSRAAILPRKGPTGVRRWTIGYGSRSGSERTLKAGGALATRLCVSNSPSR